MIWKPKEEPLTPEQAIAMAKKELAPYWFGSTPLLAAVKTGQTVTAHPIDPAMRERPWLIYFIDPTDLSGSQVLTYAWEWHQRFSALGVGSLFVIYPFFQFLQSPAGVETIQKKVHYALPVVLDHDGLLSKAFKVNGTPKVALIDGGHITFEREGLGWEVGFEAQVQDFLRKSDPGLPIAPPFRPTNRLVKQIGRIDFGRGRGVKFPEPGFTAPSNALGSGHFKGERPETLKEGSFFISGEWMQDQDRIATADPAAVIAFHCPGTGLGIVAQTLSRTHDTAKIVVELGGISAYEENNGGDLDFDDDGHSIVKVTEPRLHHVLKDMLPNNRELTLRFPAADRVSVAIYGMRFTTSER